MTRRAAVVLAAVLPLVTSCHRGAFLGATMPASCRGARAGASAAGEHCVGWILDRLAVVAVDDEYDDPALRRYVAAVAGRIARGSDLRVPIIKIVDRGEAPAYARPGGYVYIGRDMLAVLTSEAELAAVLAHEMAHDAAGHTADLLDAFPAIVGADQDELRLARARDDEATADERAVGYLAAAGYAPDAMRTALLALDRAAIARVRFELAAAADADARARDADAPDADVDALAPDALAADAIAPDALAADAIAPAPAVDAISGAAAAAEPEPVVDDRHRYPRAIDETDPSHPAMAERIARVTRLVAGRTGGELAAARYRDHVAGVIVGDDPRRGMLVGSTWSSARLGLAFDLPAGWLSDRADHQLRASTPDHEMTLWSVGTGWGDAVAATLSDRWHAVVAGHPAIGGVARHDPDREPRSDLSIAMDAPRPVTGNAVAVITIGGRALAIYLGGANVERQLTMMLGRVRAIRADEIAASAPLRLAFRRAPTAGTVAEVARRVCALPDAAPWLDDGERRIAAGAPVRCVEK